MSKSMLQIGEVADRTGLSLRTVRYYEEVGLVVPSMRTGGGFRLYAEDEVHRLALIKQLKPLDFTLDELRDLLQIRDALSSSETKGAEREALAARLADYVTAAKQRCEKLRDRLVQVESVTVTLAGEVKKAKRAAKVTTR